MSSAAFHVLILVVGAAFLLLNAFHGNVWFDESYSVGIASFSFADIWSIGSNDVHPVLFYWCLHVLYLIFGDNILVYRLFAVAGMIALAALGLTHVRRDFGWRAGVAFTFLVCFTPYLAIEGTQIRMYSWAAFCVMLCFVYALRIIRALRKRDAEGALRAESAWRDARIPKRWWAAFFLSSLASAYLHYFAVIAAFLVNLILLVYLLARVRTCGRQLVVFLVGAACQVLLYSPWLVELSRQMSVVGGTYWANFQFPLTFIELGTYPFLTAPISFAAKGADGPALQVVAYALGVLFALMAVLVIGYLVVRGAQSSAKRGLGGALRALPAWLCSDRVVTGVAGVFVYVGVFAIGWAASVIMGSLIEYYRYLVVAIGPLLLAGALAISRVDSKAIVGFACAVVLTFALVNQALNVRDSYSPDNAAPFANFQVALDKAAFLNGDPVPSEEGTLPMVLSSDIGVQGVLAVTYPDIPETYLDWQPGNWGAAYQAYAPTLTSVKSWGDVLAGYHGAFVVVGQTETEATPRDITDIQHLWKADVVEQHTFYRPYERTWFTIAVMNIS